MTLTITKFDSKRQPFLFIKIFLYVSGALIALVPLLTRLEGRDDVPWGVLFVGLGFAAITFVSFYLLEASEKIKLYPEKIEFFKWGKVVKTFYQQDIHAVYAYVVTAEPLTAKRVTWEQVKDNELLTHSYIYITEKPKEEKYVGSSVPSFLRADDAICFFYSKLAEAYMRESVLWFGTEGAKP